MHTLFSYHSFVCLWLAVAAAEPIFHAHASESLQREQLSRQPLIEVAAFGVAPVSGIAEDSRLRAKPGDIQHRQEAPGFEQGRQLEIETRVLFGESWLDLYSRVGNELSSGVRRVRR